MKEQQNSLLILHFWKKNEKHAFVNRRPKISAATSKKTKHFSGNLKVEHIEFRVYLLTYVSLLINGLQLFLGAWRAPKKFC